MRQDPEFAQRVWADLARIYPGTGFSVYRLLCGYSAEETSAELLEQLEEIQSRGLPQLARVARYYRERLGSP